MKPNEYTATNSNANDLLTLELAYKHDPIVIALVRQVQELNAMSQCESEEVDKQNLEIGDLKGDIDFLKERLDLVQEEIKKAILWLEKIKEFKKSVMIEEIQGIISDLEAARDE